MSTLDVRPWWMGDALSVSARGLALDGTPLVDVARERGTPVYVYGARTIQRRVSELRAALDSVGAEARIFYAMKANRFGPVLDVLLRTGGVGIDACSPREVERALATGFAPADVSVTAGMLSNRDLAALASHGVHVNLDTRSALRRWAAIRRTSNAVGLRIDPDVRVGWDENPKLSYGGSKFGFGVDAVLEAAHYARSLGLEVDTLHMHAGWGLQRSAAPMLASVYERLAELARAIPSVRTLNIGGGLCWRHRAEDDPLPVATWAELLRTHLAKTGCTIACEPGTYVMAASGVLVAEVNTVEERHSGTWVGIDAGHNVNVYAAHYGIPMAIVPLARPLDPPTELVHVAGNINEANDVFARGINLPRVEEGDLLALFPAGAYGASMASDHCMRGPVAEELV